DAVRLLEVRGTRAFARISAELFGRAGDDAPSLLGLLNDLSEQFPAYPAEHDPIYDAATAAEVLHARVRRGFPVPLRVRLSGGRQAGACAAGDCLKLRRTGRYSPAEVRLLEVHEGWVHLGTSANARRQRVCVFLTKGPPSSTRTQEGLAVLAEFL